MNSYQIATIPGDGIGKEVVPESVKVLDIVAAKCAVSYTHLTLPTILLV